MRGRPGASYFFQEEDQEQAPEAAIEDLPAAPAIEGKPRFYA